MYTVFNITPQMYIYLITNLFYLFALEMVSNIFVSIAFHIWYTYFGVKSSGMDNWVDVLINFNRFCQIAFKKIIIIYSFISKV